MYSDLVQWLKIRHRILAKAVASPGCPRDWHQHDYHRQDACPSPPVAVVVSSTIRDGLLTAA
jgi:hypothetical protein